MCTNVRRPAPPFEGAKGAGGRGCQEVQVQEKPGALPYPGAGVQTAERVRRVTLQYYFRQEGREVGMCLPPQLSASGSGPAPQSSQDRRTGRSSCTAKAAAQPATCQTQQQFQSVLGGSEDGCGSCEGQEKNE